MGGVDNSGAGAGAQEEGSDHQTVEYKGPKGHEVLWKVTNAKCTMEYEGRKGQEALRKVTLKGGDVDGDVKHYRCDKGEERFYQIDRANRSTEFYQGPPGNEWLWKLVGPDGRGVLYEGYGKTRYKAFEFGPHYLHIYTRDGLSAPTSKLLRKTEGGKFFVRRSEEDEWEELEFPDDEWFEEKARKRKEEARLRAEEARLRAEQEVRDQARKRKEEEEAKEAAERAKRRRFAEAQFGGRTLVVGSVSGADRAVIGEDYCDTGDEHGGYAPNTDAAEDE